MALSVQTDKGAVSPYVGEAVEGRLDSGNLEHVDVGEFASREGEGVFGKGVLRRKRSCVWAPIPNTTMVPETADAVARGVRP